MLGTLLMSSILFMIVIVIAWRWYQVYATTSLQGSGFVFKIFLGSALITLGQSIGNYTDHSWVGLAVLVGLLVSYTCIDQVLNSVPRVQPLRKDPFFIGVGSWIILQIPFSYVRGDVGLLFLDEPFQASWLNYVTHLSYFITLIILEAPIAYMFFRRGWNTANLTYSTRCFLGMLAFLFGIVSALSMILSLQVVFLLGEPYRASFNVFFHLTGVLAISFLLISIAPERVIRLINLPMTQHRKQRMQQEHTAIAYLHNYMIRVVPQVHLPITAALRDVRQLTEIGDARDLILSQVSVQPPNARDEAHYLYLRSSTNHALHQTGPYTPKPIIGDVKAYYLAVARHLQELERTTHVIPQPTTEP